MPPIYATSTYVQSSPGVHKGLDYGRSHNPTRLAFERCIADLESGAAACAFASGLAAISTVLELVDAGAHVVASDDLYGGTFRLFERVRTRSAGTSFSFVDFADLDAVRKRDPTRDQDVVGRDADQPAAASWPTWRALAQIAREHGLIAVADNTFASPYVQRPLELGFDIVVHSTTKYLNGHSDVIGGVAVVGGRRAPGRVARALDLPAERGRRDRRAVRQLPGAARREDAGAAHGAPQPQRARRWRSGSKRSQGGARALPRAAIAPAACAGQEADAWLRRHGVARPEDRSGRRASGSSKRCASSRWPRAWAASRA